MTYESLQHFAQTWGLVYMVAIFVGVVLFVMRPAARHHAEEAKMIPFREDSAWEERP